MTTLMTWTLGELIAKARKEAQLDQKQLAAAVKIARNSLSNYETDRSVPPFDVMVRIANACGVELEWFANGVNDETPAASATGVRLLSQHSARLEGLEPPTFWLGVWSRFRAVLTGRPSDTFWTADRRRVWADLACQVEPDTESTFPWAVG